MKLIATILMLLFLSCNQSKQKTIIVKQTTSRASAKIDTSKYAILTYDKQRDKYYFDANSKIASLNFGEIAKIEELIIQKTEQFNKTKRENNKAWAKKNKEKLLDTNIHLYANYIEKPQIYFKQLIATTNSKGEKIIFVNCFCSPDARYSTNDSAYWKKGIVEVSDGGSCYFQLKINLTKNTVYDFLVNGVA